MKKLFLTLLFTPLLAFGEFYTLNSLDTSILESMKKGEECILKINEGDVIPFNIKMTGEVLDLIEASPIVIQSKGTFFIKVHQDDLHFSYDMQNWKSPGDFFGGIIGAEYADDGSSHIHFQLNYKP